MICFCFKSLRKRMREGMDGENRKQNGKMEEGNSKRERKILGRKNRERQT